MSLFEYVAAGYTLLLSFTLLRVLSGIPHAVRMNGRYWVYVLWLLLALEFCFVTFIAFWPYQQVEWTTLQILGVIAIPGSLYAYCSILVPPDPAAVTDWKAYFFSIRVPLFATAILFQIFTIISSQFTLGLSPFDMTLLTSYMFIAIYVVALCTARPHVHVLLAIAFTCIHVTELALLGDVDPIQIYNSAP